MTQTRSHQSVRILGTNDPNCGPGLKTLIMIGPLGNFGSWDEPSGTSTDGDHDNDRLDE